jgi:hypothetical protein
VNVVLAGLQYLPSVVYFVRAHQAGILMLEQCENYQKRTWRNRTAILGRHDPLPLTVPLARGKHEQQPIREVRIAYDADWPRTHLRSIRMTYGRTPFFGDVMADLAPILLANHPFLWDLNLALLEWALDILDLPTELQLSVMYQPPLPDPSADMRPGIPPGQAPPDGVMVPTYLQVQRLDGAFQPDLSILDVLFHLGPGAGDYVDRYARLLRE